MEEFGIMKGILFGFVEMKKFLDLRCGMELGIALRWCGGTRMDITFFFLFSL